MRRKTLVRSIMIMGGSYVVTLPSDFVRRHNLSAMQQVAVTDAVDHLLIRLVTPEVLRDIQMESKQIAAAHEQVKLRRLHKTYAISKIVKPRRGGAKW